MSLMPGYEFVDGKPVPWLREGREVHTQAGQVGVISEIPEGKRYVTVMINGRETIEQIEHIRPVYDA